LISTKNISAGIECFIDSNGKKSFKVVLLQQKKKIVNILSKSDDIEDLKKLFSIVNGNIPISLVVSGKGIIYKKIAFEKSISWQAILDKSLPNADVNDFYIQTAETTETEVCYISIIRKNVIDDIIQKFIENNRLVTSIFFGPFSLDGMNILLGEEDKILEMDNYNVSIQQGKITNIKIQTGLDKRSISNLKLGFESIEMYFLLAYSSGLKYYFGESKVRSNILFLDRNILEFKSKKKYLILIKSFAACFFVALMVNYIFYRNYVSEKNLLDEELKQNSEVIYSVNMLRDALSEKQKLLKNAGIFSSNKFSYYIDQISYDVPDEIKFNEIILNPIDKINDTEGEFIFLKNIILVRGICDGEDLNSWISLLRKKKWIKGIEILNYERNKLSGSGEFEVRMKF
jgi:hypothetical protein